MILDPDGVEPILLAQNLRRIKLKPDVRAWVLAVEEHLLRGGECALEVADELRAVYVRHRASLKATFEANERARRSMLSERLGCSESEFVEARRERVAREAEKLTDIGL